MQDEPKRQSRLRFSQADQREAAVLEPNQGSGQELTGAMNPRAKSRLQLTEGIADPKLEKAAEKLDKAKARLPKKKAIAIARATDEATGKTTVRLRFEEKIKPPSRLVHEVLPSPTGEIHRQVSKTEDDNVGLKAAHGVEKGAESAARFADNSIRAQKLKAYRAADKAERQLDTATTRLLQKKEQLSSNPFSRRQQKRAIKQNYMAAKAAGNTDLERKIMEEELFEFRALMRSENITMEGLASLIKVSKETSVAPLPATQTSSVKDDDDWMDESEKTTATKQEDDYDDYE